MSIPLICIALLGFLGIGLGFTVSTIRAKVDIVHGSSIEPEDILYKAIRAHGNTMEYVPLLALLIFLLSQYQLSAWVTWFMVLVTASRYLLLQEQFFISRSQSEIRCG